MNNNYSLSPIGEFLMNLPTVYEIIDDTKDYTQPNRSVIVKSKLSIADKEVHEGMYMVAPAIYTYTIKNVYDGGEKTIEIK